VITQAIAEFAAGTRDDRIPATAVTLAKRLVLDSLGVTLAGSLEPGGRIIADYVEAQGGAPQCAIAGRALRTSPSLAALANATMAHGLNYDDISVTWLGHPSSVLVPAILALGTQLRVSGRQAITAYVVGWEVGAAVGRAIRHNVHEAGWHSAGIIGAIASAAACANLMGLDVSRTRTTLGISASMAAGVYVNRGTDTKPLHVGNAARSGIMAADLADRGFTAAADVFDGPGNLCLTVAGPECDQSTMLHGLGSEWDIVSPGGSIKLHACSGASQYCVDALLDLVRETGLSPAQIDHIECHVPRGVPEILVYAQPTTGLEAKFSMQYALAAALLDGRVGITQFTDAAVRRPQARALMAKVGYVHPPDATATTAEIVAEPHSVVVHLNDGSVLHRACRFFRGRAENPLTNDELRAKFHDCAAPVLSPAARDRLIEQVDRLDALDNLDSLDAALAGGTGEQPAGR
jgi:2-methylcitrate dehydratase PrpD